MAAFGTAAPFACTSQQRIWLSHDPAANRFEAGLQATQEMPSVAALCTSTSADNMRRCVRAARRSCTAQLPRISAHRYLESPPQTAVQGHRSLPFVRGARHEGPDNRPVLSLPILLVPKVRNRAFRPSSFFVVRYSCRTRCRRCVGPTYARYLKVPFSSQVARLLLRTWAFCPSKQADSTLFRWAAGREEARRPLRLHTFGKPPTPWPWPLLPSRPVRRTRE